MTDENQHDGSRQERPLPRTVAVFSADHLFALYQVLSMKGALEMLGDRPRVLVLGLEGLPALDARGVRIIRLLAERCRRSGTCLVIGGAGPQPRTMLARAGLLDEIGSHNLFPHMRDALVRAQLCAQR
jgi:SulP family sulfate permease